MEKASCKSLGTVTGQVIQLRCSAPALVIAWSLGHVWPDRVPSLDQLPVDAASTQHLMVLRDKCHSDLTEWGQPKAHKMGSCCIYRNALVTLRRGTQRRCSGVLKHTAKCEKVSFSTFTSGARSATNNLASG